MDHPAAVCVLRALLVLVISPPAPAAAAVVSCPRPCSCPQPTELHCTFRSLVTIPAAASKDVERMNLGFNSINTITDKSLAGLRKLELLMVHGNDIHTLPDGAFRDLASLQMLKISYNKLTELSRNTLRGLWSLARLHLDHNRLEFIHPDAFQGLTSLRLLQLEGNQLQQLHPATFATFTLMGRFHVSTLRHLHLSDNGLASLPSGLVATMPQLENLYLHGNPWTCDCDMSWLYDWDKTSSGVLKCKKDRALPGGELCPMCSSPRHLEKKELAAVENLACSSPVVASPLRTSPPEDTESEVMTSDDFREPLGNVSLGLSDEHGNEVDLECSVGTPRAVDEVDWEQVNQLQLAANLTLSVDLDCPVDRDKYERLWRLIAYYSNVPAHLQRRTMLSKDPHPTYVYRQDSEKDALYYTGVKANVMAQPAWLMQASAGLRLNRLQSSAKMVKLILSTELSETVAVEQVRRQKRTWVSIESTNATRKVSSAVLGSQSQMHCNVRSSGPAVIRWTLPDGSTVEAPHGSPDDRVTAAGDGRLVIKSVSHKDSGIYYCVAKVRGDLAVLSFYLTVQESSGPAPGEGSSIAPLEVFAGSPVSLPCRASGSPDAEIDWILPSNNKVGFQANSSRAVVYSNGTLHIPQTQLLDSGYYKCIAMNQHGVDTLSAKITVVRRRGILRPLRKFPARPQSASGVNTQIKVLADVTEEASGDVEVTREVSPASNRQDPSKRKIPGGVVPGRKGAHPSRNVWRRPPVPRKPPGSQGDDRKQIVESRRRTNVSKGQISPEKWADILAKIRDRKAQRAVTSPQAERVVEGSSDGVAEPEKESRGGLSTPRAPVLQTEMKTNERDAQTSSGRHTQILHTTTEPHTAQTAGNMWHTRYETATSALSLPQTTSVPLHAVTFWQASSDSVSSAAFSLGENNHSTDTDVDAVTTAERDEKTDEPAAVVVVASSNDPGELFSSGSQIIPSVKPNESRTSQEENVNYLAGATTISQLQTRPEGDTRGDSQSRATQTAAASLTTAPVPTAAGSERGRQAPPRLRQPGSRGRNGGRRKRPNRRKEKLNKPTTSSFTATAAAPANVPPATVRTTGSARLKIEPLEVVTAAKLNTAVPFSGGQAASSGRLSHKESTVSEPTAGPSLLPTPPPTPVTEVRVQPPLAEPPPPTLKSPSAAPSFPTTSPAAGHGETATQTASGISGTATPPERPDALASATRRTFTGGPLPTVGLLETQRPTVTGSLGPVPFPENSSVGVYTATAQTDVQDNQYTPTETVGGEGLAKGAASSAFTIEHGVEPATGYTTPSGFATTPGLLFEGDSETERVTTRRPEPSESSSRRSAPSAESEVDQHDETRNTVVTHPSIVSATITLAPPASSTNSDPAVPSKEAAHVTRPVEVSSTGPNALLSVSYTATTPEPGRISDYRRTAQTPGRQRTPPASEPTGGPPTPTPIEQEATPAPAITAAQTNHPSTRSVSRTHRLPAPGSVPRGKPRISQSNFQTFTVKAETDAQLPCEAEGEPRPFLSWTNVASGASIAQNTRVQRFEVHPNGTLIIRNAQRVDGGQYLCTVQNQYGTDKVAVDLVVLPQHPPLLRPRSRDVTVHLGGSVDLECRVEGHPGAKVMWVLPNHVHIAAAPAGLPTPQQRVAVLGNGSLRISRAAYADRGVYKCTGGSAAGADSVSVHLHVSASPPAIQQAQSENATFPEGSDVYVHCTATGDPPPVIRWVAPDGAQLAASQLLNGHKLKVFPNGTLFIRGLGPASAGRYECSASNAAASSRRTVTVTSTARRNPSSSKARVTSSSPQRTDVIYGSKLLLDCVATGEPAPWIIWRTPSKKLVDSQYSFDPRIKVFPNGTITVHSATDKDSGDYLCVARNKMGDDYVPLRVHVLTRPAKIEQKLQRSTQEVVHGGGGGGGLRVDCVASGLPNPAISWALPDGTMVNPVKPRDRVGGGGRSRRYVVFDNGTLYFNDVGLPEEGDYTCYAENQLGKDEMKVRVKVKALTFPPQIQDKGRNAAKVFYGETVALPCHAKGEPMPAVTWISPTNRAIAPAPDKYQVLDDGTLVVQKAQRFDGGNYTCVARNSAGRDQRVIGLEVLLTPPVINGLRESAGAVEISAVRDQRRLVDCVATGTPTPRVMWVLPENVILPAPYHSNRMTVHQNGTLEIRSIRRTDSGRLACIARNEGGEVRVVFHLDVKEVVERPQFRGPRTDSVSLTVGNAMALNCSFEGTALTHVTWILPNGKPLLSGARFFKFFHRPGGSLIISNPSVGEAGAYRCLGQSSGGLVERTISLSPGRKPEIGNRYSSPVSVMNGETLSLRCLANGEPLRLTWTLPSGVVLNRPQRAGRYSVLPNGTLAIQKVSVHDRGAYLCRAANEYGSALLSASVTVTAYPPRITNGPPSVTYAKRGVAVQLNCAATGTPRAEVAWETPDKARLAVSAQPRLFGNKYLHPQGSLVIQNPTQRDAGVYRCTARNAVGVDSKATYLNVF